MLLKFWKRRQLLGAALCVLAEPALGAVAPTRILRLVTADLPPLVGQQGGAEPGALMELVEELARRVHVTLIAEFMPWKRAIFIASTMPGSLIFPLTRTREREAQFRWLAPLYEERYIFLAPKGRAFDVTRPAEMKGKRISLIRGSALQPTLLEMGYKNIVEASSVDEVHRFLVQGMADADFGELSIVRNSLRTRGSEADFDIGQPLQRSAAWLAGSLDFSDADGALFQKAMREMSADGVAARILKKYGMA